MEPDRAESLIHVVVQITRDSSTLLVLDGEQFPRQRAQIVLRAIEVFNLSLSSHRSHLLTAYSYQHHLDDMPHQWRVEMVVYCPFTILRLESLHNPGLTKGHHCKKSVLATRPGIPCLAGVELL